MMPQVAYIPSISGTLGAQVFTGINRANSNNNSFVCLTRHLARHTHTVVSSFGSTAKGPLCTFCDTSKPDRHFRDLEDEPLSVSPQE